MSAETTPQILPFGATVLAMRVEHFECAGGPETLIVRSVDRPDLCTLCPRELCDHAGGYCVVRARCHVPAELCAGYALPAAAGAPERPPGLRVEGG